MRYQFLDAARLTDFAEGQILHPATGASVPATPLHRKIALHFRAPALWEDFADPSPDANAAFAEMCAAGLLIDKDAQSTASDAQFLRPDVTMFEVPHRQLADIAPGEIVFLGAPIDIGTTAFPGARYGPDAIRAASVERYQCKIDLESGTMVGWNMPSMGGGILNGARLSDLGDFAYTPGQPSEDYYQGLRAAVTQIYAAGGFPVVLGGDHSVTYATIPPEPPALAHFDAHCDLAERVQGHCHHHGNVLRRLLDEGRVRGIHHYGLRDTAGWDTLNAGTQAQSTGDLELEGWSDAIAGERVFLSVDLDVLDPSILPGTGTPVVGGLSLRQLCAALARIIQVTTPVGMDLVELCPIRDSTGLSERMAVEVLLCALGVYHAVHGNAPAGVPR